MSVDSKHIPINVSARRSSVHDDIDMMDFRYAPSPRSGSPLSHAHYTRMARMDDGRPVDTDQWDEISVDPLAKSPSARRRSTIPIPDLSTLALGVPAVVIAGTANDPLVSSPPAARRRLPMVGMMPKKHSDGARNQGTPDGGKIVEMGPSLVSPIEPIALDRGEVVPGIDTKRPSIGVTRPSDEDKRRFVEGWAEEGRNAGMGVVESGQMPSSRRSVNFTHITTQSPRYYNPRKESDFSTTSSGSGTSSTDYPLIYSPNDSPPLDARTYRGTILDLVSDPQELREYRDLERRKEMDRRESGGSTGSGSRSGSINLGRSGSVHLGRPSSSNQSQGYARKGSFEEQSSGSRHSVNQHGRHHHARSTGTRRTTIGEHSGAVDPTDLVSSPSRAILQDINTCLSPVQVNAYASSRSSPTSPITLRQHLFHPDLHPVADHHVPGTRQDRPDVLSSLNVTSQSDDALYVHTRDPIDGGERKGSRSLAMQQTLASLTDSSSTDETSPSSSGTIRPPLGPGDGPKARTVADFGAVADDAGE